ncbi:hypothetical protein [Streptomyces griseomycini]|uniref:Histone H3/H4 n=1 Tax=Streptomyces griseomycini TaxID=66895 RepID=A0A7W7M210_9ACTN|nr:hypothetical protein [Streptomyces griseomycini]MBB4900449.1 histone H3/H4 [Streptomyces griseomycini]GGQ25155.1 hypothetical protein GCM10010266_55540 [Streptomyces griseomycini]GGR38368.1 hypothetical protein GCM10015536_50080 [Streptomyces griseomycini]
MTTQPVRPERSGPGTASVVGASPFRPSLVKAVFRDVTPMHVSRSAAWAAASVTRTVLTEIIDGARRAAAEEARKKLVPGDLLSAIDRNVELEVGTRWYDHSPTFRGLTGVLYDAGGVVVPPRGRSGSRRPSAVVGAHRFEAGVKKLLRSRGATAVPAMVRDLDGIASVFLTDLARDAAMVVREGGVRRFGAVTLVTPGEPAPPPLLEDSLRSLSTRRGDGRTIGRDDVLAATTIQLFGGSLRQRALAEAHEATRNTSAG